MRQELNFCVTLSVKTSSPRSRLEVEVGEHLQSWNNLAVGEETPLPVE